MAEIELDGKHLLTARQLATIAHLLASPSIEEACRRAKVSKPTVYSWLKDEGFQAELQRRREEVYKNSLDRLKAGGQRAVEKILKLIDTKRRNSTAGLHPGNCR